jgi:predicted ATP-dependent protease
VSFETPTSPPAFAALAPEALCRRVDPAQFAFETTTELDGLSGMIGQARATEALRFGIGMRRSGYNLFVLGPGGLGKHTMVRRFLEREAAAATVPADWCYVYNFERPDQPRALRLPSGRGAGLRADMESLSGELIGAVGAAFESDDYRSRLEEINEEFNEREGHALRELGQDAEKQSIALLRTPAGFALAPMASGEVINPEQYEKLPADDRERISANIAALYERLHKVMRDVPQWGKQRRERIKQLNREFTLYAAGHLIDEVRQRYQDLPEVLAFLDAVSKDIVDNADEYRRPADGQSETGQPARDHQFPVKRYHANLVVDHAATRGAPVVFEDHPTFQNLIGRVEYFAQFGALLTDFSLIKGGALHRANGGFLMLDALKLLSQPFAWEALKRSLSAGEIRIHSLAESLSLVSTVSLEPQSIPLDVKVVLFGERSLYYLMHQLDPEFRDMFKVSADFDDDIDRDNFSVQLYARLIAGIAAEDALLPLDSSGVARAIEHAVRLAGDVDRISAHMQNLADLLREADFCARRAGRAVIGAQDVAAAIEAQVVRADRARNRMREEILAGTLAIDTSGRRAGQINGLSVFELGQFAFGLPTRISATVRLGGGEVIDIQREVKLGGPIHTKGVLILASFLAARYACDAPLSLSASLVFEQTYGQVEGDSASVAELCVLLSALADTPIDQRMAVTGSVSQHGEVQAIGGANEKIEGFFDLCKARGFDGGHAVLIPQTNVRHLMLREDVVAAVQVGRFRVFAVEHVDQALELLTGLPAGVPDADGKYPPDSVNGRVAARLAQFAAARQAFGAGDRKRGTASDDA